MEHPSSGLQGSRAFEYHEAELALLEAGPSLDSKYVAVGYEEFIHGALRLDTAPLRRIHYGRSLTFAFVFRVD